MLALRGLAEETGGGAASWHPLGSFANDGNRRCGRGHFSLARGARRIAEPPSGDREGMVIGLMGLEELAQTALAGDLAALSAAAIGLAAAVQRGPRSALGDGLVWPSPGLGWCMKLGVLGSLIEGSLNGREGQPDGLTPRFRDLRALAEAAEAMGLDSFWVWDHLLYRDPQFGEVGCWEAFTFLGALAASTSRIALGPLVACTAFRNPALLAKMADSLDEISGGRFALGLGCGWHAPEFVAFGYPFDRRVGRFAEALQIIAPLLRTDRVGFQGQYYQARDVVLRPRGPSPAGPPLWIGAKRPRMLRLAAQYADVWNTDLVLRPERVTELHRQLHTACAAVGRDPATLPVTAMTAVQLVGPGEAVDPRHKAIFGVVEEVAAALRGFADVGVQHLVVDVRPVGLRGLERFARVVELLRGV